MRFAPVTALLASSFLGLTACGADPAPPQSSEDTLAPRVTTTTPAENAEGLLPGAMSEVSITFNEPMKPDRGVLVPSGGLQLGAPSWSGTTLKVPIASIRHDEAHSIELKDFQDLAGNTLDGTVLLGDGKLDFRTSSDLPRAAVSASLPAEGSTDLYPVEMHFDHAASRPGVYFRKILTVTFTEAMKTSVAQVTLENRTHASTPPRPLTGQWSSDGRTLTITLLSPEEGGPPLEEESSYALDLRALRSAATGNLLDATSVLGDGKLDFTTGKRLGDLEHACTHAFVNRLETVQAAENRPPFGFPPPTDTGHTRYEVTLPGQGSYEGYTELVSAPDGDEDIVLYLNRYLPVSVSEELTGTEVPVEIQPTAPVCSGITHQARFSVTGGNRFYFLRHGPTDTATFELILERHGK